MSECFYLLWCVSIMHGNCGTGDRCGRNQIVFIDYYLLVEEEKEKEDKEEDEQKKLT